MTATTMSAPHASAGPVLERWSFPLLLAFVASLQISIAASQAILGVTCLLWAARLWLDRARPSAPRWFLPLGAYALATLASSLFSLDPIASFLDSRQLLLLVIVPLVYDLARGSRAATVVDVLIAVGAASAVFGVVQYGVFQYDHLGQRVRGALGLYMTYSGVLMLVLCAVVARLVFGARDRTWPALVLPALVVALSLTLTRSTWVGALVGVGLLLMLRDFRLVALLPVAVALFFAVAPDGVTSRMLSIFSLQDPTNRDRLAMVQAGVAMVQDRPLTGVGPDLVPRVYPEYRAAWAVQESNPHLHNVPLQIAAERGLPALGVWIWFVAALAAALAGLFRTASDRTLAGAGLAALAAMLAAGLFEYNFGDSEFLMLFLVLITLPFAAARRDDAAAAARA